MLGLFLGELNFRGAYYWKEFCIPKLVWLDNKNSLKQRALTVHGLITIIREGLLSEGFLRLRFGGLIFGRAYFLGGLLSEFYGNSNSLWAYIWEGLLSEGYIWHLRFGGLIFGRAYFWRGSLSEFHDIL